MADQLEFESVGEALQFVLDQNAELRARLDAQMVASLALIKTLSQLSLKVSQADLLEMALEVAASTVKKLPPHPSAIAELERYCSEVKGIRKVKFGIIDRGRVE
ncbi:hypothetical protein DEVEQU_00483 [Devosia equisanguinis]|uniref:Uncharacterized protein n=1 Tax=Devosia equisanguinis TaxID=2490941 RepID=A0A3S4GHN9_9HYPH|nr:hypothetical protein [Devosia equisanguinis]VDS03361.1 hypothetical protein DEVEQU_00483 [Devosia equisanguinis]